MNAFSHDDGFVGRIWLAAWAAFAGAAAGAAFPARLAAAAEWGLDPLAPAQSAAITIVDESYAPVDQFVPHANLEELPLGQVNQPIGEPGVEATLDAEGVLPGAHDSFEPNDALPTQAFISDSPRCPRWTAQIDALLLWQTNIPSRSLYIDSVTEQTVLNANQAIPPVSAAPRYALLYHRDPCHAFEINYFQIQSFAGTAVVGPGPNPYVGDNLPGAPFADIIAAQVNTTASLKSWEFNLRRSHGGFLTWIGGFRWVEWNQRMAIGDLNATGATGVDGYLMQTGNNLYGAQFGADALLWNAYRKFKVNGLAKGGVYYNHQASQSTSLFGDQSVAPDSDTLAAARDTCSFVGEVGLTGEYKIAEWLSWRAGYTLFWLGGIATPANQLSLSDFNDQTTSINTYSSAFLHGVTTGLEARW